MFSLEPHEVTFKVYLGDKLIQKQTIQAPYVMIKHQFANLVSQIVEESRPMKIKMIKPDVIWDQFEQQYKTLNNYVLFHNQAMGEIEI